MTRRRVTLVLAACAAGAMLMPVPARAMLRFGRARTVTPAGLIAFRPHVAYDAQDRATLAWTIDPPNAEGTHRRIQATRLSADGAQGPIRTLSPVDEDAFESEAQVAVDSHGRSWVVWEAETDFVHDRIKAVRLDADGTPGPVLTLSDVGGVFPKVAVDSQDRATVVWWRVREDSVTQIESVRIDANGVPGPVQTLSPPGGGDAADPSLAVDSQDRVTVVWSEYDGTQYRAVQLRLDANGNPGGWHVLSAPGGNVSSPQVAVGSQGQAQVVWEWDTFALGGSAVELQTAQLSPDEAQGPVRALDPAITDGTAARLAFDSHDRVRAVWQGLGSGGFRVKTRPIAADGSLGPAMFLSPAGRRAGNPELAFDSHDRAVVAFDNSDGTWNRIRVLRLDAGGRPSQWQTLSAGGRNAGFAELALDSRDRALVAWDRRDASDILRVQYARGAVVPPDAKFTDAPHGLFIPRFANIRFTAPGAFSGHFECSLDGRPFKRCRSPRRLRHLRFGRHVFKVRARDEDGVDRSPAVTRWRIPRY